MASPIDRVPNGERWVHEIKFDVYRVQIHLAHEEVKIYTRRGHDWSKRFKKIANDAWHISAASAIINGEVVVPSASGATDFSVFAERTLRQFDQDRVGRLRSSVAQRARPAPLFGRKAALKNLIAGTNIQFSESFEVDGAEMFAHACKLSLKGVVSKVRDSVYPTGARSRDRVKKACAQHARP
ncbi:hypothetical protein ACE103_29790 [Bradyrhizobium sp. ma5]|uniref:ATP-dependent DNA ligase n=1 Tax=Bradyrhizobium sp. ma5 TaxID=3344828 RepID=UPI0035D506E6